MTIRYLIGLAIVAVAVFAPAFASAHDTEIVGCNANINIEKAVKLNEGLLENGMVGEEYDTNGDGKVDILALSTLKASVPTGDTIVLQHAEHPTFYIVDVDHDGAPDVVYVDKSGTGKCEDIVLYENLNEPRARGLIKPNNGLPRGKHEA